VSARTILIVVAAIVATVAGALLFRVSLPHVQLAAEAIGHIGPFTITNTILTGWISSLIVLLVFWAGTSGAAMVPSGMQNFVELISEFILGLCESVAGVRRGREFFPIVATIFFFVITANWLGLVPGFGTIGLWESAPGEAGEPELVPFFRPASSDLNTTLAIALTSVGLTQIVGLRHLGLEYVGRFFNFRGGPIGFYVGLLELIAEFAKIISFTFRLFGNVFAGEVLIAVMTFLLPWIVVLPFYGLELFVGFIQAFVFAVLTLVFMSLATESHAEHGEPGGAAHH
jgi:F-type H+-transporting ATPase subunit a